MAEMEKLNKNDSYTVIETTVEVELKLSLIPGTIKGFVDNLDSKLEDDFIVTNVPITVPIAVRELPTNGSVTLYAYKFDFTLSPHRPSNINFNPVKIVLFPNGGGLVTLDTGETKPISWSLPTNQNKAWDDFAGYPNSIPNLIGG